MLLTDVLCLCVTTLRDGKHQIQAHFLNISIPDVKAIEFCLNVGRQIHRDAVYFGITDS